MSEPKIDIFQLQRLSSLITQDQQKRDSFNRPNENEKSDENKTKFDKDINNCMKESKYSDEETKENQNNRNIPEQCNRSNSRNKPKSIDQTQRAYEYYKQDKKYKEQIYLGQQDMNFTLSKRQQKIENQIKHITNELNKVSQNLHKSEYQEYDHEHYQLLFQDIKAENQLLKKQLQAIQIAKETVPQKNKGKKKLWKTIEGVETHEIKDRKKFSDLLKLVDLLKKQLKETEEQNRKLQSQNNTNRPSSNLKNALQTLPENQNSNIKLTSLQAKNDELYGHYNNLKNQLKTSIQQNQTLNQELREWKEKANNLSRENRMLQLGFQSAEEYQKQIIDLKKQRDQTENRLKELLSSPFFKEHGEKALKYVKIQELEEENLKFSEENKSLNQRVNELRKEVERLENQIDNLKQEVEFLRDENDELKIELTSQANKFGPLQQLQQMDHKTYLKTLGEITMNSHKLKIQGLDELLENNQDEKNQVYVKNLQQEIEQLKRDKGEIAVHLEKIQTMLKIQMDITQEKESIHKAEKEAFELKYNALLSQAQELAQISDMKGFLKGDVGIQQQQEKQKVYKKNNVQYTDNVSVFSDDEEEENQTDKQNGCNYFDFWIGLCQIYQGNLFAITNGKISENEEILVFSTVDFYDHDIQTTPISQAKNQTYFNFQCSYKITTKDDFLLYLSTGSIKIELYAAVGKDALLLGSVEVPLLYLFQNNRQECISAVLNQKCQLNFAETIIGQIEIKARLRYPISNQIKLFVQKNSTQDKELEEQKDLALEEYEDNKDQSTKRKLVVIIDKAQGFNEKSSTFIYYQIQNKDYYTKSVPGSQPKYDHHQIHDICHLDKFKNILNKVPLEFVVFDDFAPLTNEYEQHDIVGIASTKLDGLNSNLIIDTVLTIYNDKKIKVGLLYIKVFWYEYQDQIQISSKFGQGLLAKQWEKDFTLKLAKTLKNRQLNTNNGFMIFDRNNDKIISKEEFLNTCLGTLNMVEFNRDEVLYYYSKQKQPFDKIAFEQLLRPYMLDDISKLKYLEEISILQKAAQNNEEENKEQYAAQERLKNNENQQQERMNQMQSIKELNNILNDNTKQMTTQKDEVLREMIGIMIVSEMKKKSALEVFAEIDKNKDEEIDTKELTKYLLKQNISASQEEIFRFLSTIDANKNNKVDILEFINYVSRENMTKILYMQKYPKKESISQPYSDEQIIYEIEEKIFYYMKQKKIKILKLHENMDLKKKNSIGKKEFKDFFIQEIGIELTSRDLNVVFNKFDQDGDGVISVKEFVEHLKNAINKRKSLRDLRSSVMSNISPDMSIAKFDQTTESFYVGDNASNTRKQSKAIRFNI